MKSLKIFSLVSIVTVLCVASFFLLDFSKLGKAAALILSSQTEVFDACIRSFSTNDLESFKTQQTRLNTDAIDDAIISYTKGQECGSAGCIFELCLSNADGTYTHSPFGFAAHSLETRETSTNSMKDLILNNDENLEMSWNGQNYELNAN